MNPFDEPEEEPFDQVPAYKEDTIETAEVPFDQSEKEEIKEKEEEKKEDDVDNSTPVDETEPGIPSVPEEEVKEKEEEEMEPEKIYVDNSAPVDEAAPENPSLQEEAVEEVGGGEEEEEEEDKEAEKKEESEAAIASDAAPLSNIRDLTDEHASDKNSEVDIDCATPLAKTKDVESGLQRRNTDITESASPNVSLDFPHDEDEGSEGKASTWKRYKKPICFGGILLLVTILIGVIFASIGSKGEGGNAKADELVDNDDVSPTAPMLPPFFSPGTPTASPTRKSPTASPTRKSPTYAPTISKATLLLAYLKDEYNVEADPGTPGDKAVIWLAEEATSLDKDIELTPKIVERFAALTMYYSLSNAGDDDFSLFKLGMREAEVCQWIGFTCNDLGEVSEIHLGAMDLDGSIPSEIGLLQSVKYIDLSNNQINGPIPEELYDLLELEKVFMYRNNLSGTISNKLGNLWSITHYHVSDNQLTGSIPATMKSGEKGIFPIRYFNVYSNRMSGTFPEGTKLRRMWYMDLGRNQFTGTLPTLENYVRLRHLHLDFNEFVGTVPATVVNAGQGRLKSLTLNNNQLTGFLPGPIEQDFLVQYTVQNNDFSAISVETCKLNVFVGGQLPEFVSNCDVCNCGDKTIMCMHCVE